MSHSASATPGVHRPEAQDIFTRYWNANLPKERWTEECPEYLKGISEKNKGILSQKDEDFTRLSWTGVQDLVSKCLAARKGTASSIFSTILRNQPH